MGKPESIRIGFVGDIALGSYYYKQYSNLKGNFFKYITLLWRDCNFLVGNFEGTMVAKYPNPQRPKIKLQVPGFMVDIFSNTPFKIMTCANNHILDSGPEALLFTIETLRKAGILVFGAGVDKKKANRVCFQKVSEYRFAWIGGCGLRYAQAGKHKPGAADFSRSRLLKAIKFAKAKSDLIIIVLHADFEFRDYPSPFRQKLCRKLIDAGANAVICHHPHIWQGIEHYHKGLIAYSIGNFLFSIGEYQKKHSEVWNSGLLKIDVSFKNPKEPSLTYSVVPMQLDKKFYPVQMKDKKAMQWLNRLKKLSKDLSNKEKLQSEWAKTSREETKAIFLGIYYCFFKKGVRSTIAYVIHSFKQPLTWHAVLGALSKGKL